MPFDSIVCRTKNDQNPHTKKPPSPNQPCVFPFNWMGKQYNNYVIFPSGVSCYNWSQTTRHVAGIIKHFCLFSELMSCFLPYTTNASYKHILGSINSVIYGKRTIAIHSTEK